MRILFGVPYIPRPEMSGTLREYFFLAGLARRHTVRLVVGTRDESFWTPADVERVRPQVESVHVHQLEPPRRGALTRVANVVLGGLSSRVPPWWIDPRFQQSLRDHIAEFRPDVVFSDGPVAVHCHTLTEVPVVVDFCDALSLQVTAQRHGAFGYVRRRASLRSREAFIGHFAPLMTAISERDADAINVPRERLVVVPNGVDLEHYVPRQGPYDAHAVVFVGSLDYKPNVDAARYLAEEIWPLIRREDPAATLFLVGRTPVPSVVALHGRDGITVTGTVEDVRPYVWGSAVSVAPLRFASGLQNKVLQALAMAVPVVMTPAANGGMGASEADGVLVREGPAAIAAATLELMRDPERRSALGERGRRYVVEHFRWEREVAKLEQVLERAIATRRTGA